MIPLTRKRSRVPAIITMTVVEGGSSRGKLTHAYSAYEISSTEFQVTDGIDVSYTCDTPYEAIALAIKLAGWQRHQIATEIMRGVPF